MTINRRRFLKTIGAAVAVGALPATVRANANPHVVVLGGGFAGATVAKYLRMWSENAIDVTLVDPNPGHVSCVLSNLVLNGEISLQRLTLSHGSLSSYYGVKVLQDRAASIDGAAKQVTLASGKALNYQHLVVATGIDFQMLPRLDFDITPHAWIAGPQTQRLANQVQGMAAGSTFVMTIPRKPYRCPPGPYERACLVADILKRRYGDGGGRVVVLD
jgi:NADPH-dependent 2,4-dienoyl-CoA reductase/sulfur reductase-like enzyme